MFRRLSDPLPLSEASLLVLRPALNAPVLNVDFLPVGPARAAIVVFAEEYGGIGLAIGVRSNEGGQIAVFRNQEPIDASTNFVDALDPALATAERMGFLFDEDILEGLPGGEGRARALVLWGELMGDVEPPQQAQFDPDQSAITQPTSVVPFLAVSSDAAGMAELLLDDEADFEMEEISLDLEDEFESNGHVAEAIEAPAQQLSKFRNASPFEGRRAVGPPEEIGSELGRIPLVRVRRDKPTQVPYLARLLSSF